MTFRSSPIGKLRPCLVGTPGLRVPGGAAVFAALASACAVGSDYRPPVMEVGGGFARADMSIAPSPEPADLEFWRAFDDPLLVQLVEAALEHNHDIRIAFASHAEARALLRQSQSELLPSLSVAGEANEGQNRFVGSSDSQVIGSYSVDLSAVWELDVAGRIRRGVEAQRADAEATAADLAAMQVSMIGELVSAYFELRGRQEQLRIARENAANLARTRQTLMARYDAGIGTRFDIDRGQSLLETSRARIPALERDVAISAHRISVLTGSPPSALISDLEHNSGLPAATTPAMAVDTPSDLLRRRPDVAAAERRLAAATARVGVATADLFPRFTLSGLIGTWAPSAGDLFQRDAETRQIILGVDAAFLNVGRVRARIAAADAAAAGRLAAYERTVLAALEETENALIGISRTEQELEHLRLAAEASERAVEMARERFDSGEVDLLEVLDAERVSLSAEDAYAQGRMRRLQASVALYRALAGGWPLHVPAIARLGDQKRCEVNRPETGACEVGFHVARDQAVQTGLES